MHTLKRILQTWVILILGLTCLLALIAAIISTAMFLQGIDPLFMVTFLAGLLLLALAVALEIP